MERNNIEPSQLIEVIISTNNWLKTPEIVVTMQKFNELTMALAPNINIDFCYPELLQFIRGLNKNLTIISDEPEIHIHKAVSDMLIRHLKWYNKIYSDSDEFRKKFEKWIKNKEDEQ